MTTRTRSRLSLLAAAAWASLPAVAQTAPDPSRGALLYGTHCVECHNTQMHWRDNRVATDWGSLKAQVRRWQARERLGWSEADIVEVTRHLNDTIYRFEQTADKLGLATDPAEGRSPRPRANAATPLF